MNIYGSQFLHGTHAISGPHTAKPQTTFTTQQVTSTSAKDEVMLSSAARQSVQVSENAESSSEIRFDLVNRIRSEILAGTYETPEKLNSALEKMLVSIGS